jgi:hypothetical protein
MRSLFTRAYCSLLAVSVGEAEAGGPERLADEDVGLRVPNDHAATAFITR